MTEQAITGFVMNRDLQRNLLLRMREVYPHDMIEYLGERKVSSEVINALLYMQEHGLCVARIQRSIDDLIAWGGAQITARGLDFLEDDGGLSAILGVVTVKLHAETVRELIAAKIDQAKISEADKSGLKKQLASLPQTALQAATSDLMRAGLEHVSDVAHWVRTLGGF
jgi:hypothetical protein